MVNYTKKKYLNLFLKLSFVFLCIFCFTKNVSAKVLYEEATPSSAYVLLRATDQAMSTQSIINEGYNGQTYYGFRFGSVGTRYGVMFNYAERSSINDKYIESIHFSMIMPYFKTDSGDPFNVYLKDTYNNNISCQGTWGVEYPKTEYDGTTGKPYSVSRTNYIATFSCYKGHLSGPFSVNLSNEFTNEIGFIGISELSIHYNDGSSQDSSTLNDIKGNTKETNDILKDSNVDDSGIGNIKNNDNIPTTSGIQDLLTMPIKFLTSLNTSINGTCSPISLPYIKDTTIVLPCYDLGSKLGILWTLIDLFGVFIIIKTFGKTLKRIFVDFTSLNLNKGDLIE